MDNKIISKSLTAKKTESVDKPKESVAFMMNTLLDKEKMKNRFDELLGKRSPQFISSLVTMVTDDQNLQEVFYKNPMSIIKSALRAAAYDLPIDPSLGFAYIMPFNVSRKTVDKDGNEKWESEKEATFVMGYKGMIQLCLRTGAYSRIPDAVDVRQGELVSYDRLTGDAEFDWIEDEDAREKLPVIGYAGYFRLKNGAEKTIYMSKKQIDAHELKNRKGGEKAKKGKGWRDDYDAMARKTVIRRLISKYGLMSIDYQDGSNAATLKLATAIAEDEKQDELDVVDIPPENIIDVDDSTGEVKPNA